MSRVNGLNEDWPVRNATPALHTGVVATGARQPHAAAASMHMLGFLKLDSLEHANRRGHANSTPPQAHEARQLLNPQMTNTASAMQHGNSHNATANTFLMRKSLTPAVNSSVALAWSPKPTTRLVLAALTVKAHNPCKHTREPVSICLSGVESRVTADERLMMTQVGKPSRTVAGGKWSRGQERSDTDCGKLGML
jgi:hypothetical protein